MAALRDYQQEIISGVRSSWSSGHKRPCIVAPCGSGKTVIASELAKRTTDRGNRVVFIVHRKELCAQTESTFRQYGVDMELCRIGMVQTLTRREIEEPKLIIVDENHHVYAKSYTNILDRFPSAYVVGLTATPVRMNGGGLGKINDDLIIGPSVSELIEQKHLAPFRYYSHVSADTSSLQVKRGEFVADEINKLMGQEYIFGDAVENYRKYGCKKTIVYCSSIQNSKLTAEAFCEAGIAAMHVDGETPKRQRDEIMSDFRNGKILVLCNVDLVSEGFDVPDCDSCILLRPTMSLTLHVQQSMRSMRYMPGKTAIIIDHVENFKRFGLPDTPREWTLDYKKKQENKEKIRTCESCYAVYEAKTLFCAPCGGWDMRLAICESCGGKQQYGHGECRECGGELVRGVGRQEREHVSGSFEEIQSFTFKKWQQCKSVQELQQIQKAKGFKPGWVYYRARELRLI